MKRSLAVLALVLLTGCGLTPRVSASMAGEQLRVRGASYEQVWQASHGAISRQFPRAGDDGKARGELLAGSNGCSYGPGNYVGVYIAPVAPQAAEYSVKIVADDEGGRRGAVTARALSAQIAANLNAIGVPAEVVPSGQISN